MAYENFIPKFWSENILRENNKLTVLANLMNREYEGTIKSKGDTVTILGIGGVTVGDYTGADINSPETLADTSVKLVVDKAKYFNVLVDDVDKRQAVNGLMGKIMAGANEGLADTEDTDIGAVLKDGAGQALTTIASLDADKAWKAIADAVTKLRKKGVKKTTKVCAVVTPEFFQRLAEKREKLDTDNTGILENGFEGKAQGVEIYISNTLPNDGTNDHCFVFTKGRAIAHAASVSEVEALRSTSKFADIVRGLLLYGTKVVRPQELVDIKVMAYA